MQWMKISAIISFCRVKTGVCKNRVVPEPAVSQIAIPQATLPHAQLGATKSRRRDLECENARLELAQRVRRKTLLPVEARHEGVCIDHGGVGIVYFI
jgi:hypothetical protein